MSQRGIALGLAVLALAVVGGLVSTAFLLGLQEQRVGVSTIRHTEAFAGAEAAVHQAIAEWPSARHNAMPVGTSTTTAKFGTLPGWHRLTIERLNRRIFLVYVEAYSRDSTARQALGQLVRLAPIPMPSRAAVLASGSVVLGGGARVSGADVPPYGWTGCAPAGDPVPDITPTDGGEPRFEDLTRYATVRLRAGSYRAGPAFSNGECDRDVPTNWGDPWRPKSPCGDHFPVVWIEGDLTLQAGTGQGVLLVDGDLEIRGGFEFYGAVWVRRSLTMSATAGHLRGVVVVSSGRLDHRGLTAAPAVTFSRCALERALLMSAPVERLRPRGWIAVH